MPTRVLKRRGSAEASAGAAAAPAADCGPVDNTPSAKSARASLPPSSPPDVDCDRLPDGPGPGRHDSSGIATLLKASVVDAAGGLLSLGGCSAPVTDAQDAEATAVHVDIITRGDDNEQGGEAGEEARGTSVAKTRERKWIKTCKLPGCKKRSQTGKDGYCCAHHTELVLGVEKRPRKPVPQGRICSVSGCSKRIQQGGVCCRHGAFDLNTCDTKGCRSVAVHGIFCSVHTETCAKAGCRAAATSGYYCQRHCGKPPPRKTVARTPKKWTESANEARIDAAISAVQTCYGIGGKRKEKLGSLAKLSNLAVRGVTQRPTGKWQAQVYHAGGSHYLGVFPSRTEAVLAYEVARELLDEEASVGDAKKSLAMAREAAREAARKASTLAESSEG
ncbi:hypothetical protein ACHAXT_009230 [Thalassiosira profunda]